MRKVYIHLVKNHRCNPHGHLRVTQREVVPPVHDPSHPFQGPEEDEENKEDDPQLGCWDLGRWIWELYNRLNLMTLIFFLSSQPNHNSLLSQKQKMNIIQVSSLFFLHSALYWIYKSKKHTCINGKGKLEIDEVNLEG